MCPKSIRLFHWHFSSTSPDFSPEIRLFSEVKTKLLKIHVFSLRSVPGRATTRKPLAPPEGSRHDRWCCWNNWRKREAPGRFEKRCAMGRSFGRSLNRFEAWMWIKRTRIDANWCKLHDWRGTKYRSIYEDTIYQRPIYSIWIYGLKRKPQL